MIRIAVDLKLFDVLVEDAASKSLDELESITGADGALLAQILRSLAAVGAVKQSGVDTFMATNMSRTFAEPSLRDGSKFCFDVVGKAWQSLPEFLRCTGYKEPSDAQHCAINMAFQTNDPIFEMLAHNRDFLEAFNSYMTGQRQGRTSWLDFYPVEQQLIKGFSHRGNAVMIVDVGGGQGHEIQEVRRRYPTLPGRAILQDLAITVSHVSAGPHMEVMAHDFFTPQPIKGESALNQGYVSGVVG